MKDDIEFIRKNFSQPLGWAVVAALIGNFAARDLIFNGTESDFELIGLSLVEGVSLTALLVLVLFPIMAYRYR